MGGAFLLAVSATLLSDSCPTLYSASSPQTHRHRIAHNLQRTSRFITHASPQAGGGAHIHSHTVTHTQAHSWKTFSFFGWHSAISIGGGGREDIQIHFESVRSCCFVLCGVATRRNTLSPWARLVICQKGRRDIGTAGPIRDTRTHANR